VTGALTGGRSDVVPRPVSPTAAGRPAGGPAPGRSARSPRRLDLLVLSALLAWTLWVATATLLTGHTLAEARGFLAFPLVLGAGLLLGRLAGVWSDARTGWVAGLAALALPALLCVLAAGALTHSFYANAQATSGVQIVAISALLLLTATLDGAPRGVLRILVRTVSVALVLLAATLGLVLAARAQAALMLVVVVVVLAVVALVRPALIPRRMSTSLGGAAIGGALAVVLALTTLPVWPRWLGDAESLSFARQLLWRDALELWGRHPLLGGGPGAFYDSSPIARSEPHLYAAHSSVLQVGSELGTPGALLFLVVLALGLLLAARGDRARALIGIAAWSALAVHSMIDHLYEFPIVVLLAGIVLGAAGARRRPRDPAPGA
jgi:O-antigen ligase